MILNLIANGKIDEADAVSRDFARRVYLTEVRHWSLERKIRFIDQVTGGLGYRRHDISDFERMVHVGSFIAWSDAVEDGSVILEIGTGLGRTLYVITSKRNVKLYLTCDINPYMLAIALFENPISDFQDALWKSNVKIMMCDAVRLSFKLSMKFNHIVHDGGPCPEANPRLYSAYFLRRLVEICDRNGKLSVFAGRNRRWVEKLYKFFREQPEVAHVVTVSVPGSSVKVLHVTKKS